MDPGSDSCSSLSEFNSLTNSISFHLLIRPEYQQDAAARLEGVKTIAGKEKKVLFVGLHVRRTDYVQFSKQVLGKRVASKAFYQDAMDYFEEEYPDHSVYFLAVSDDLNWVRKHLGGRKNLVVAGSHGSGEEDGLGEVICTILI